MSETPDGPKPGAAPKSAFTLDLSSGSGPARAKRPKGFVPVVQQTINLTRKKTDTPGASAEAARPSPAPATPPRDAGPADTRRSGPPPAPNARRDENRRDDRGDRPSGGTGLADVLDAATLARLRGGA